MDQDTLMEFVGKFVGDLGATMAAGNVVVGDRLGLYRALADRPAAPGRAGRRAPAPTRGTSRSGCAARPPAATSSTTRTTATYSLTEEQAFALTDPDGPLYLPGAFELALGALRAEPRIAEAFRTGDGHRLARARRRWSSPAASGSSGPATCANLVPSWIPALDGVEDKLQRGRPGRRRRLRPRRVDGAAGAGVPGVDVRRLATTTRGRSRRPASGPPRPASATG